MFVQADVDHSVAAVLKPLSIAEPPDHAHLEFKSRVESIASHIFHVRLFVSHTLTNFPRFLWLNFSWFRPTPPSSGYFVASVSSLTSPRVLSTLRDSCCQLFLVPSFWVHFLPSTFLQHLVG